MTMLELLKNVLPETILTVHNFYEEGDATEKTAAAWIPDIVADEAIYGPREINYLQALEYNHFRVRLWACDCRGMSQ